MEKEKLDLGNPLRNLVGQSDVEKPSDEKILENILNGMAEFGGTCWSPVKEQKDGIATSFSLMLNQCPQGCGDVWRITIADKQVANWLVNEINQRRHGGKKHF
jgi:hypothetical protein